MNIKGTRILVTGGAGFIGSHIVDSLVIGGAEVIVFDNLSSGKTENLDSVKRDIELIQGDILDYSTLLKACEDVDVISHQAAQLEIFRCIEDPIEDLRTNTIGTLNVLNAAKEANVGKVINASSACVYGEAEEVPQSETHPKRPNWAYGVSKLAAEKYCELYLHYYNIPIVSLRYGIVYGEREWFGRVLSLFIKRAIENQPLIVFGDGQQLRDFIHVSDVVTCHNKCIEKDIASTFNVSTSKGTSINALVRIVSDASENDINIIYDDVAEGASSEYFPERKRIPFELKNMVLDNTKAKKSLGWEPKIALKEGVKSTFEWASNNPRYWDLETISV